LLPSFFKACLLHILVGICMPIDCSFLICSRVPCMGVTSLWPNIQNNICGIFLLADLQLTYKLKYLKCYSNFVTDLQRNIQSVHNYENVQSCISVHKLYK